MDNLQDLLAELYAQTLKDNKKDVNNLLKDINDLSWQLIKLEMVLIAKGIINQKEWNLISAPFSQEEQIKQVAEMNILLKEEGYFNEENTENN